MNAPTPNPRVQFRFGEYCAPRCQIGDTLFDEYRGTARVIALSDGPIPWPIGTTGRGKFYILCGDLVKAVRQESNTAVALGFGVRPHYSALRGLR